jgi:hypothetical protein
MGMALTTRDVNGTGSSLVESAVGVGLGVAQTGKELEVAGNIVSRGSAETGGTAIGIASEPDAHGSIWTNAAYDPSRPGSGWKRTINLVNGNVGIGGSKDAVARVPAERLVVAGNIVATGDVQLSGADCAEEFSVGAADTVTPGTVLVIGDDEELCESRLAYDTRVAGVVSGAGAHHPGIILGRRQGQAGRLPVALNGTVYCKVDAGDAPIRVGDLLTTSPTPGHAMRASDPARSPGAVLGKAMRGLPLGRGLIPVLVTLH